MLERSRHRALRRGCITFVLLLFALAWQPAQAIIVVDSVSTVADDGNPASLTVSHTTGAGADRLMIVGVSFNNDDFETALNQLERLAPWGDRGSIRPSRARDRRRRTPRKPTSAADR